MLLIFANGRCMYNMVPCAPDDPGFLALIAHVAPVEALASAAAKEAEEAVHTKPLGRSAFARAQRAVSRPRPG